MKPCRLALFAPLAALTLASCTTTAASGDSAGLVPNPILTPASGGHGEASGGMRFDVGQYGYEEKEYYFEGTARTFAPSTLPPAAYKSRMIVWTPRDPKRFNGATVVEWAEVSDFGKYELTIELNYQVPMLMEQGYAFVLVSAEEGGVCDRTDKGCTPTSLIGADPGRYGTLNHPGDAYAFDIFNQALQAIKHPSGLAPLGGLRAGIVIAEGFQPSIDKWSPMGVADPSKYTSPFSIYGPLNAYLAVGADESARLADAFLIDAAAPLNEPARYRVPTLHHLDESAIRRVPAPDGPNHVTWEVVGSSHVDRWTIDRTRLPSSQKPPAKLSREAEEKRRDALDNYGQLADAKAHICQPAPGQATLYPRRYTLNAALAALHRWVSTGKRPSAAPRIQRVGPVPTSASAKLVRDADGNAIGGLRSPIIKVPVAAYNGEACIQAGTTVQFPPAKLAALYPTHQAYVRKLLASTNEAVRDGFLICEDAERIMRGASASAIGGSDAFAAAPACASRRR